MNNKVDEILARLRAQDEDRKKGNKLVTILAIIGFVAAVAAIAYAVYRFFTPDYLEDFEDDFDDDFDDYFEDDEEEEEEVEAPKSRKEKVEESVKAAAGKVVDAAEKAITQAKRGAMSSGLLILSGSFTPPPICFSCIVFPGVSMTGCGRW